MESKQALINLGLTEKQAQVYIALLQLGKASVTDIANQTQIKRPTVYLMLEELRKLDLALKVPYAKKALFLAKEPDNFFNTKLEKAQQAHQSLNSLKAIHKRDAKVSVMSFEGETGIQKALLHKIEDLKGTEVVGFFAKAEQLSPNLVKASHGWRKKMKDLNIKLRGIAPEHASLKEFRDSDELVSQVFKTVSLESYSSDVSIDVTDLFARITLFDVRQAVIIENKAVVKTLKEIFEMVWEKR